MKIQTMLKLLAKKYPNPQDRVPYTSLVIFTDGSGRVVKDATEAFKGDNLLLAFDSVEELVTHLKENRNDTESS